LLARKTQANIINQFYIVQFMNSPEGFLFYLLLLLVSAKIAGEAAERSGFPSTLGYLLTGMFYSSTLFVPLFGDPSIPVFGQMGAMLLLFVAGMRELDTLKLVENRAAAVLSSVLGFFFPFFAVSFLALNAGLIDPRVSFSTPQVLILVTALSVSSVVPVVKVLVQEGKLNTRPGKLILSSAVINAIIGLVVFTLFSICLSAGRSGTEVFLVAVVFVVLFYVGENIIPVILDFTEKLSVEEAQFTLAFVIMLLLAGMARFFGLHGVIGAFVAGILVSKSSLKQGGEFSEKLASLAYGVFVPLFFVWIGLRFYVPFFTWFFVVLVVVLLVSNFVGVFLGLRLGGVKRREAVGVSVGMLPRGGVDLVILAALFGVVSPSVAGGSMGAVLYSSVVLATLGATVFSRLALEVAFRQKVF